jgi:hypothetical protein
VAAVKLEITGAATTVTEVELDLAGSATEAAVTV